MEPIIKSFSRVVRGIDEVKNVLAVYERIENANSSDESTLTLTPKEKRSILDFPEPDVQRANIAAACPTVHVTESTESEDPLKASLLQRAKDSPRDLSGSELSLLKLRYWAAAPNADRTEVEKQALRASFQAFDTREEWLAALERLRRVRHSLYDANEEAALDNALAEDTRRLIEAAQGGPGAKSKADETNRRSLAAARPWVRRMWEEDVHAQAQQGPGQSGNAWGYPVFVEPGVLAEEDGAMYDEYAARRDGVLWWARHGACLGDTLGSRWRLQRLAWPEGVSSGPPTNEHHETHTVERSRRIAFQKLREEFTTVLTGSPKKQTVSVPMGQGKWAKFEEDVDLHGGLLPNVFLVIDQDAVNSIIGPQKGVVDDMWVWAVDPDYTDNVDDTQSASLSVQADTSEDDTYRGFLRVRLQQLVNNFYEARRYRETDYPMKRLWRLSQKSRNGLFISIDEEEINGWLPARDVGSAIRPPKKFETGN